MKNKLIRISIIITFAFLARVLVACCDCFKYQHYNYDRVDVYPLDNSGPTAVVSPADSIGKNAFGLRFDFNIIMVASGENKSFDPFTTASAIDCSCGELLLPRSVVSTLQITTLHDFDADHPANSDVTSLFKILRDNRDDPAIKNYAFVTISEYFDSLPLLGFDTGIVAVDALLLTPPAMVGKQSFNIKVTMTDGRIFNMTTAPITLY